MFRSLSTKENLQKMTNPAINISDARTSDGDLTLLDKEKLSIEREKLAIEKEKIQIEKEKLHVTIKAAEIRARASLRAANIRNAGAVGTGLLITYATYQHFKPIEKQFHDVNNQLAESNQNLLDKTHLFMRSQLDLERTCKKLSFMERKFVNNSKNKDCVDEYNRYKELTDKYFTDEVMRIPGAVAYSNIKRPNFN